MLHSQLPLLAGDCRVALPADAHAAHRAATAVWTPQSSADGRSTLYSRLPVLSGECTLALTADALAIRIAATAVRTLHSSAACRQFATAVATAAAAAVTRSRPGRPGWGWSGGSPRGQPPPAAAGPGGGPTPPAARTASGTHWTSTPGCAAVRDNTPLVSSVSLENRLQLGMQACGRWQL